MIDKIRSFFSHGFSDVLLWGYGWKRRKTIRLSQPTTQWQDPFTGLWYGEKAAVRLLKVQVMDEYRQH